ncbi:DegV family EDD domain-containing protein [Candidatus Saccharibacteria bacterium]|nr:DegV family EDD domain-containing protein [Candidatus Saccharibacteria bacterium]
MQNFQILTDRVADLPARWVNSHDYITVVDTPILITGKHNLMLQNLSADDFGQVEQFFKQGDRATTSQPQVFDPDEDNPLSVESLTRKYVREGKDVIYVAMNSALSGTYNTVSVCYSELSEWAEEQGRRVACVDSRCMSTGLALLFLELDEAINRQEVRNIDEIEHFVIKERGHMGHFFTWGELSYIKLSGRVSSVQAMLASMLRVRLMCSAQYIDDGETRKLEHINPGAKLIGLKRFADALGIYARKHITNPHGTIIIAHGNAPRDAAIVEERLCHYLPDANYLSGDEWRCGAGIQVHGGPTSLHINFRTDNIGFLPETTEEMERIIREMRLQ